MAFMVLTDSGHVAIAKSIKDQQLYLAWGDLPDYLDPPTSIVASDSATAGALSLGPYTYKLTAINDAGETIASSVVNFTLANPGHSIQLSWAAESGATGYKIYGRLSGDAYKYLATVNTTTWTDTGAIAVGSASPPTTNTTSADPWTTSPDSPRIAAAGLFRELGRRKILNTKFVTPDADGAYVTNQGRWSESSTPTKYIYAYVAYDLTDAPNSTVYQYGLYVGTIPSAGNENKQYLTPGEISNKGSLLSLENISPIIRNSSTREFYEIVMTF